MKDAFQLARSIQKHVKRLKSTGYSHPPISEYGEAWFTTILDDGRTLEVRVREIEHVAALLDTKRIDPCPFCGPHCVQAELIQRDVDLRWQVMHGPCGSATGHCTTPEAALVAWNIRNRFDQPRGVIERVEQKLREAIISGECDTVGTVVQDGRILSARRQVSLYRRENRDEDLRQLVDQLTRDDTAILDRSNMNGHITTSGLVINPEATKVLMINHKALGRWLQPGGHYEGELPLALSALREVREETGSHPFRIFDDIPLDIDTHAIPENPVKQEGDHYHHDFVYLMIAHEDAPSAQEQEVSEARWVDLDEASQTNPRMARMIDKVRVMNQKERA